MPAGSSPSPSVVGRIRRPQNERTNERKNETNKLREGRKFWTDETAAGKMRMRKEERRERPSNPHILGSKICLALAVASTPQGTGNELD